MSEPGEAIVVCEGFHDRAFLGGWLEQRGWSGTKGAVYRATGKKLSGEGQHGFVRQDGRCLRVAPAGGDDKVTARADVFVNEASTRPISSVVLEWDDDRAAGEPSSGDRRRQQFEAWALGLGATPEPGTNDFVLPRLVQTRLSLIVWRVDADPTLHLPRQQTLERLVCKAIVTAYPDREPHVHSWLTGRPSPPDESHGSPKSHAASHMAGWFAERGSEDFYRHVWSDPAIRAQLEADLGDIGATRVLDRIEQA